MLTTLIFAGFGGQGVISLGKLVAEVAAREGKCSTFLPSYGAEMRGGTAHCMVCISDKEINSPFVERPDIAVLFTEPAFEKFVSRAKRLIIANSSLINEKAIAAVRKTTPVESAPLTDLAGKLGSPKITNVVGLSLLLRKEPVVQAGVAEEIIRERFPDDPRSVELNIRALYYFLK